MRKPGEWMQLPTDERILEVLQSSELVLSPAVIGKNIDKSREQVNRRLTELVDYGFVTESSAAITRSPIQVSSISREISMPPISSPKANSSK